MKDFCKPLLAYINSVVTLDSESEENIAGETKEITIPKGGMLFHTGETARYSYFIVSGKARSYYTDYSGKTITWLFHFNEPFSNVKNLFIVDYKSFLTQTPGTISIEALTDIKLIQMSHQMFDKEYLRAPAFDNFMRILNEKAFIIIYDRIYTMLTMSATDRYLKLLNNEAHLLQMFSNYYLASYLGIVPQSLSRIRTRLQVLSV